MENTKLNAQKWFDEKYVNKNEVEKIELEDDKSIVGKLTIEDFPLLKKISVKGKWENWGELTEILVKNCPELTELNYSFNQIQDTIINNCPKLKNIDSSHNKQFEELAKFDGSELDYNIVSYIGSLNEELYEQLKVGLPGKKHEGTNRLCFGCLTNGGHQNKTDYNYHAELELTSGGIIEYGVATTGNQRETCEVTKEGGLLVININSTDNGTIKIKKREIVNSENFFEENEKEENISNGQLEDKEREITLLKEEINHLQKQVGEEGIALAKTEVELSNKQKDLNKLSDKINCFQNEKEKLEKTIKKLENELSKKEVKNNEQWKKQLQEGKDDLTKKLTKVQNRLENSKKQKQILQDQIKELVKVQKEKNNKITNNSSSDQESEYWKKKYELEKLISGSYKRLEKDSAHLAKLLDEQANLTQQKIAHNKNLIGLAERSLQRAKTALQGKVATRRLPISLDDIEKMCQLKEEIIRTEMHSEQKIQARIEFNFTFLKGKGKFEL